MFHVRTAAAGDAEAIARIHHAAVHGTAAASYAPEVIESWAARLAEQTFEAVRGEILNDDFVVLVAEAGNELTGFGMIAASAAEVRAVYVHPDHGRQGIGAAILRQLEQQAGERKIKQLHLSSSINAEAFYAKHGYHVVERGTHTLRSGREMACVKMSKVLNS